MEYGYLIVIDASEKWTMPLRDWGIILNQLSVFFGERVDEYMLNVAPAHPIAAELRGITTNINMKENGYTTEVSANYITLPNI